MNKISDYLMKTILWPVVNVGMYVGLAIGNVFRLRMDHPIVLAIAVIVSVLEICLAVFFFAMFIDIALHV